MIIFDLDGTLADCEHRRHLVDPCHENANVFQVCTNYNIYHFQKDRYPEERVIWKPDYKKFNELCYLDKPIEPVMDLFMTYRTRCKIWSGRCESVRDETIVWLYQHTMIPTNYLNSILKMRPIGDFTPDEQLKERWLEETYEETKWGRRTPIEYVFDDRPKVIDMWRRHGIFVFDCNQTGNRF